MKKRLMSALLSTAMVVTLLAGCGGTDDKTAATDDTAATEAPAADDTASAGDDATAAGEEVPEAKYYFSFDGAADGAVAKENDFTSTEATTVETRIIDSAKTILYTDGVLGQCAYLDGSYGIELPISDVGSTYTLAFWMNAARFSQYGPVIQFGSDLYSANTAAKWVNITKTKDWVGDTFPIVWSRDETKDIFPWFDAEDGVEYGKKEWVHIAIVCDPTKMTADGIFVNADLYVNGAIVVKTDAEGNTLENQLTPDVMASADDFHFYIGINCWDTIFKGAIDELYVFDTALTAGQVATLYAAGDPTVEVVEPASDAPAEEEAEEVDYTRTDVVASADAVESLGTTDCQMGFWTAATNAVEIADGESKTIVFDNHSDGSANWCNYVVALTNTATTSDVLPSADNYEGYAEYAVVRADLYGWGDASYAGTFTGSWGEDWDAFLAMMKDANVTLTVTRSGSDVTLDAVILGADGAEYTSQAVITSTLTADAPCYFFLTGEHVYIDVLSE